MKHLYNNFALKSYFVASYDTGTKVFNTRKVSLSKLEYHGFLNELWIKLDQYQNLKMCKASVAAHVEVVERWGIFKFLWCEHEYDPIRVQNLGREKLSSLSKVFLTIKGEEIQRDIKLNGGTSNTSSIIKRVVWIKYWRKARYKRQPWRLLFIF